ncbi:hypothetical protein ACKFKG_21300 [Phormidesmis sp. 146-35]
MVDQNCSQLLPLMLTCGAIATLYSGEAFKPISQHAEAFAAFIFPEKPFA